MTAAAVALRTLRGRRQQLMPPVRSSCVRVALDVARQRPTTGAV